MTPPSVGQMCLWHAWPFDALKSAQCILHPLQRTKAPPTLFQTICYFTACGNHASVREPICSSQMMDFSVTCNQLPACRPSHSQSTRDCCRVDTDPAQSLLHNHIPWAPSSLYAQCWTCVRNVCVYACVWVFCAKFYCTLDLWCSLAVYKSKFVYVCARARAMFVCKWFGWGGHGVGVRYFCISALSAHAANVYSSK